VTPFPLPSEDVLGRFSLLPPRGYPVIERDDAGLAQGERTRLRPKSRWPQAVVRSMMQEQDTPSVPRSPATKDPVSAFTERGEGSGSGQRRQRQEEAGWGRRENREQGVEGPDKEPSPRGRRRTRRTHQETQETQERTQEPRGDQPTGATQGESERRKKKFRRMRRRGRADDT
jgi:hypothetical protein